jgi:hypothetical protein
MNNFVNFGRKPAKRFKIEFLTEEQCLNEPDATYLIDGIVPESAVGVIIGSWGSLKTFHAIDISLTIASGTGDYHGRAAQSGAVCYIAGEGAGGIGKRVRAWRNRHKREVGKHSPFFLIRRHVDFLTAEGIADLVETLQAIEGEYGVIFKLVVVDTVSRALNGKDEDASTFSKLIFAGEIVKERMGNGCSVLLIHHKGKDATRGGRGSSVIEANADFILDIDRKDKADGNCTLTIAKLKDDEDGLRIEYVTKVESWTREPDGKPMRSLVMLTAAEETPEERRERENKQPQQTPEQRATEWQMKLCALPCGDYDCISDVVKVLGMKKGRVNDEIKAALPLGQEFSHVVGANGKLESRRVMRHAVEQGGKIKEIIIVSEGR